MQLLLLRHGIAEARDPAGGREDADRVLTPEGRDKVRQVARGLRRLNVAPDLILSSPLARARQTAEIVAEVLRLSERVRFSDHLATSGAHAELIRELRGWEPAPETVLLVGHEPDLSELTGLLLTGRPTLEMRFKKAGLCRLTLDRIEFGPGAVLDWFVPPKILRALG